MAPVAQVPVLPVAQAPVAPVAQAPVLPAAPARVPHHLRLAAPKPKVSINFCIG